MIEKHSSLNLVSFIFLTCWIALVQGGIYPLPGQYYNSSSSTAGCTYASPGATLSYGCPTGWDTCNVTTAVGTSNCSTLYPGWVACCNTPTCTAAIPGSPGIPAIPGSPGSSTAYPCNSTWFTCGTIGNPCPTNWSACCAAGYYTCPTGCATCVSTSTPAYSITTSSNVFCTSCSQGYYWSLVNSTCQGNIKYFHYFKI